MVVIYWNVHSDLNSTKVKWLEELLDVQKPDIFCLAEGPLSIIDSSNFIRDFTRGDYRCYYNPTLNTGKSIAGQYDFNEFGLNVFIRRGFTLTTNFSFANQKQEGRIIYLRKEIAGSFYSFFLIHGMSKSGDEMSQSSFMAELFMFIKAKTFDKPHEKVIIMGDFNLEPWDDLLRVKKRIFSHFFDKSLAYHSKSKVPIIYFNPIVEYLKKHPDPELIGTFYHKNYISILDFPLLSQNCTNYSVEILTDIKGKRLLDVKKTKQKLVDGFDHLPILLKIV